MPTQDFKDKMTELRNTLAALVSDTAEVFAALKVADQLEGQDKGEMCANVMLGLRHLEDAAMRFGKGIQASSGGVSPLGGPSTPGSLKNG